MARLVDPAAQRRAKRRPYSRARPAGPAGRPVPRQPRRSAGASPGVPSSMGGSKSRSPVESQRLQHLWHIGAGAKVAEGKVPSEGSVTRSPVSLKYSQSLQWTGGGRAGEQLGRVSLEPDQMGRLVARVEAAASVPIHQRPYTVRRPVRATIPADRESSQSQAGGNGLALAVHQPGAVALPGDRERDDAAAQALARGSARSRSTAAASSQVRAMSCSTPPPGRST